MTGFLLITSPQLFAVEKIKVMALFSGKAMVEIDGRNRLLKVGEKNPDGVLLISADAREAVIEIAGRRETYQLGSSVGGHFAEPERREVIIPRDVSGAFFTVGSINGRTTDMLVDTGATVVAMSEPEARRLGIAYRLEGKKAGVSTASGETGGYLVMLDRVQVGEIQLSNVQAIVVEGNSPQRVLLGMSFLNRVEMLNQGNMLRLRKKF